MNDAIVAARPSEVLLVEDSHGDVRLTREALKEGGAASHLSVVGDGSEALKFLRRDGKYASVNRPDLILLDLNLPKVSGYEVLHEVKTDPELKCIPVVVLTTSTAKEDILGSYSLNANCYVTKPLELEQFMNVIRSIEEFWLTVVRLPNGQVPACSPEKDCPR